MFNIGEKTIATDDKRDSFLANELVTRDYVWANSLFYRTKQGAYDGKSRKIVNVRDGVDKFDAVNVKTLKEEVERVKGEIMAELAKLKSASKFT